MKRIFKYLTVAGLSSMLCLFLAIPADAQRGGHGGGGGGFHGGGGGGYHGGAVRSSGGFSGGRNYSSTRAAAPASSARSYSSTRVTNNNVTRVSGSRTYVSGRANVSVGGRGGYAGRVYVGGYGHGYYGGYGYYGGRAYYGPFWGHAGLYYNRGFYASLYYPRLGFSLGYLPYGYYPFYWDNAQFYYSNGYYYNYDNNQYTVVEPPVGAAISTLPTNAQPITINGAQYYELNGVYYLPITKDDGTLAYEIAGKDGQLDTGISAGAEQQSAPQQQMQQPAPQQQYQPQQQDGTHSMAKMGDMIQTLPQDSRKVRINGQTLFVTPDDVYLKQTSDNNGNKAYTVVGVPNNE